MRATAPYSKPQRTARRSMKGGGNGKRPRPCQAARDDEYEIGYGRPSKKRRWKTGQNENRAGRPKGAKSVNTIIIVHEGEKIHTITFMEAVYLRLGERAMKVDTKAAAFLFAKYDGRSAVQAEAERRRPAKTDGTKEDRHQFIAG